MKRTDALIALDEAFADRIKLEFDQLANGFMGSANAKTTAKATFETGLRIHIDAAEFAAGVIAEKFRE